MNGILETRLVGFVCQPREVVLVSPVEHAKGQVVFASDYSAFAQPLVDVLYAGAANDRDQNVCAEDAGAACFAHALPVRVPFVEGIL